MIYVECHRNGVRGTSSRESTVESNKTGQLFCDYCQLSFYSLFPPYKW